MPYYVRHKVGEETRSREGRFAPIGAGDTRLGQICQMCDMPFTVGDIPTLMAVGADDRENAEKADSGGWYTSAAVAVHERCAWVH
jgi:hypothetical protein